MFSWLSRLFCREPVLPEISRLELGPNDVLVVQYPHMLSKQQRDAIREHVAHWLDSGTKVLVMDGGARLSVIAKPDGQPTGVSGE
jgi:hypothetical protein